MRTYFAYIRVSTVKQGEHGSSLQEQRSAIEAYAARHDLKIAGWYEEMVTAAKLGRQKYNQMLADLEKGRAAGVIIHKIDRSARNLHDWARLGKLIDLGIDVRFAHESFDLASRGGRLAADIQAVVAADYVRNLRQEVIKGCYGRLKEGLYPLPAPMGYLNNGAGKPKTIDPIKGPLIRTLFELYGSGRYSFDPLREEMFKRGLVAKGGGKLSRTGIATILHNPFYMGVIYVRRSQQTFIGVHEALISKALFERVQAVASGKLRIKRARREFAYRRRIECEGCGLTLVGEFQKGHTYYRCHTPSCHRVCLREDRLDAACSQLLSLLQFTDEEMRALAELAEEGRQDEALGEQEAKDRLRVAIGRCDDRLTRLTDAFIDTSIDKEVFEHRKAALIMEKRALAEALERPQGNNSGQLLEKLELGNAAYLRFETPNPLEKSEVLNLVSSNLSVRANELVFRLLFPFDEVKKWRDVLYCGPYEYSSRKGPQEHIRKLWEQLHVNTSLNSPSSPESSE